MRVDAARQQEHAACVDLCRGLHLAADLHDAAARDANVGVRRLGGRHHPPAAHDQIEFCHREY